MPLFGFCEYVEALNSETVTFVIGGEQQQHIVVAKALLCDKSHWFAKLLSKPGFLKATDGKIEAPGIGLAVAKLFVYWCYHERLPGFPNNATPAISKNWKELYIDLWIFAESYEIPILQNQIIAALSALFTTGINLNVEDVKYMYDRTTSLNSPLRLLAVYRAVAQVETETSPDKKSRGIEDFKESLCDHPDFAVKAYEVVKMWIALQVKPSQAKKKWDVFMQQADVQKTLKVPETSPVVASQTSASPTRATFNAFAPGEVIEIDD